ncbi:MAG: hypothetical protein NTW78_05230 [Campylobacterales bacterium]|nr:hypothetical protein [Campylobacterales bacterium]
MTKTILMDRYPVFTLALHKDEIEQKTAPEIIQYFKDRVDEHPVAEFIAIFNHYEHTQKLNGEINDEILDAQNIIFCFGAAIPSTKILAVRPRSIGVAELENKFVIEFMEVPNEKLHAVVEKWVLELRK